MEMKAEVDVSGYRLLYATAHVNTLGLHLQFYCEVLIYMYIRIYVYMYVCIYTHTHTHTHIYVDR